jgi:hypothetical protein
MADNVVVMFHELVRLCLGTSHQLRCRFKLDGELLVVF